LCTHFSSFFELIKKIKTKDQPAVADNRKTLKRKMKSNFRKEIVLSLSIVNSENLESL